MQFAPAPVAAPRPSWRPGNLKAISNRYECCEPQEILRWGLTTYGDEIALATGFGISGVVLMHMVSEIRPNAPIFYLDTGLLFPETYALRDRLADRLGINFIAVHASMSLSEQKHQFGERLWDRNPDLCCRVRKVEPLQAYLAQKRAWITGIRRDQSKSRANTQPIMWDQANNVLKICPLATWTRKDVWNYIFEHDLPYNPLLDQGFKSIGCTHCTHAVGANGDLRAGRWAGTNKVECGIHVQPTETYTAVNRPNAISASALTRNSEQAIAMQN